MVGFSYSAGSCLVEECQLSVAVQCSFTVLVLAESACSALVVEALKAVKVLEVMQAEQQCL